jgi:hypothetical protein
MKTKLNIAALLVAATLGTAAPAQADAVSDWNATTLDAVTVGRPGPVGVVDVALVQVAVHDAVQALEGRYEPYHAEVRGARGSRAAAVAAAAHDVLVGIYPAQTSTLDAIYFNYLADKGLTGDPGITVGQRVAAAILPLRRAAPDPLPPAFNGGPGAGVWRPTDSFLGNPPVPAPFSPHAFPYLAKSDPFTLTSPARFRAPPPPALTSARYTRDYNEIKSIGALTGSSRTPEQTDLAYFYSDNFIAQWNRALRGVANSYLHRTGDSARLLALANMAMSDALITSWDNKMTYVYWRPLTAIREGASDGNPDTIADPAWQPLINTPNYSDYTSGANNVVAAATRTMALFFGRDRVTFEVTSLAPLAVRKTRVYTRFSDAAEDVMNVRIYQGIHFRTADVLGRAQGTRVAEWAYGHFLLPAGDGHP